MMKILLFGVVTPQGGIQTHMRYLSKLLADSGMEVLVIAPVLVQGEETNLEEVEGKGIQLLFIKSHQSKLHKLRNFKEIARAARRFKPDVYYGIGTGWNLSLLPLVLPKQVRTIFHEVMSGVPVGWRDPRWGVKYFFDEVVGQSPIVANTFAECFGWKSRIAVLPAIPEPLELTAHLPKPQLKAVELGKAKAALFSRLVPHKQAFWLVKQWDLLKDVLSELHIHGSGPEESLIKDYIEVKQIGDRVKCFGRYPGGQDYVNLLSCYDLTLLPTIGAEGAPLVLLESMACGVPFVAYSVGGIADYGVDNPNVVLVPYTSELNNSARENSGLEISTEMEKDFIAGIRTILFKLADGKIDQVKLKEYYLQRYSYSVLKQVWLSYLDS